MKLWSPLDNFHGSDGVSALIFTFWIVFLAGLIVIVIGAIVEIIKNFL